MTSLLLKAIKKAGKRTRKYFKLVQKTKDKDERTIIRSAAEKDSRQLILDVIHNSKLCDVCAVTTENGGKLRQSHAFTLVVDALDGMNNFRLGIPNFSVSAAILKGDEIIFGVVYHPILRSLYSAHKGKGAFKNGKAISVNQISDIKEATVSYIHEYRRTPKQTKHSIFGDLIENDIKRFMMDRAPSNNFCLLAEGKIEWVMCNQESLYDFSSGKIIAEEAGAITTYVDPLNQKDTNNVFVTTNASHELSKKISGIFGRHVG